MSEKLDIYSETKKRTIHELENDARYKAFFSQYSDYSVGCFIRRYADHKADLVAYGNYTNRKKEQSMSEWQNGAWLCLEEIQQKKLFDLSCKWQMGEINHLPEIETTLDFKPIGNCILDYDGIPDISEEEMNFYRLLLYTEKNVIEYPPYDKNYQDYEEIKEHYDEHSTTGIRYYDLHNAHTKNKSLHGYGGLKLKKEMAYIKFSDACRADKADIKPKEIDKPDLSYEDEEQIKFARKFNDLKMASFIKDWRIYIYEQEDYASDWALDYLKNVIPEKVPIDSNSHWLDATYEAAIAHKQRKIYEWLPSIYEEYLLKKSTGIRFATPKDYQKKGGLEKWYRDTVLDGRELKGEPKNFDF